MNRLLLYKIIKPTPLCGVRHLPAGSPADCGGRRHGAINVKTDALDVPFFKKTSVFIK